MSHYEESDRPKSNYYGPFRKPRSTKRTFTRDCTIEVNENILIINPGKHDQQIYPRPPHTYAEILKQIITENPKRLTLCEIYKLLADKYPYFQHAPMDWRNSIRNCLSTNTMFKNVNHYDSKGFRQRFWILDENVLQQASAVATPAAAVPAGISPSPRFLNTKTTGPTSSMNNPESVMDGVEYCGSLLQDNVCIAPFETNYARKRNHDFSISFDANVTDHVASTLHSNYFKIFCIDFIQENCQLCKFIHETAKKHFIECGCLICSNDSSQPAKKFRPQNSIPLTEVQDADLNASTVPFDHSLNFEKKELEHSFESNQQQQPQPQFDNNDDNSQEHTSLGDNFSS